VEPSNTRRVKNRVSWGESFLWVTGAMIELN
jgi:hypothetical protein